MKRGIAISLLLLLLLVPAAVAQEEPAEPEAPAPIALDDLVEKTDVSTDELKFALKPKSAEELGTIAATWKGELEKKVRDISEQEIANLRARSGEKAEISRTLTGLRAERDALVARLAIVIDAWKEKGGDAAALEKYVAAVTGTELNPKDVEGIFYMVRDWIVSPEGGIKTGLNIVFFFVILIAFRVLSNILGGITRRAVGAMRKTSDLLRQFFVNVVRKLTFFIGLIVALSTIGVNVGPFVAAIGAVGFIVGFALQGTLSNFAAGIMILMYRPYDIGNFVTVSGVSGTVNAMSLVSTTLLSPDNQIVTVPNGSIWGGIITNVTGNQTRRVDMTFGIGYGDDIAKAQSILEDVLGSHELVLKDPAPVIRLSELADSSVNFVVRPWCKTSDYWTVKWDVTRKVKERFDAEGVSIPFPQRDVHLHQVAAT